MSTLQFVVLLLPSVERRGEALTPSSVAALQVFAPKATAWRLVERRLRVQPTHTAVLFSSVAALLGSPGQANYSAANSWLDAAAAGQQAAGGPALSVQFGAWKGAGMAAASAAKSESIGLGALTPATGLQGLHGLLLAGSGHPAAAAPLLPPVAAMAPVDWPAFLRMQPPLPPYFANFAHLRAASGPGVLAQQQGSEASMAVSKAAAASKAAGGAAGAMSAEQRLAYVTSEVEAAAKAIMGGSVSASEPLMAAGLDSLGAVELRNSLEGRLGMQLPSTLVFDYPTISAISGFIADSLEAAEPAVEGTAGAAVVDADYLLAEAGQLAVMPSGSGSGLLAVSGMASRSPAGALEAPCQLADAMSAILVSRWEADLQLTQDLPARFGGFLGGAFLFDAAAFGISGPGERAGQVSHTACRAVATRISHLHLHSPCRPPLHCFLPPAEAILMDPQQRLLLECTEEALAAARLSILGALTGAVRRSRGFWGQGMWHSF